jgi:hypothetical protein
MENDKRQDLISYYELYNSLLTEKQREYFEDYYFYDLSITEIALNHDISRNAVFDQIKRINKALEDYENKLNLSKKIDKIAKMDFDKKEEILKILGE